MLSSLCLPLPSLSLSPTDFFRASSEVIDRREQLSPLIASFRLVILASRFIRATLSESFEKTTGPRKKNKIFLLSYQALTLLKTLSLGIFWYFRPTLPTRSFSFQTIITTTLAPRGAGVGLLSLRRARFARRDHMFSPSPSRARADRLSRPVSSLSSRRAPSPSTTVSGADGPAHAAFIEPISFFVAEHVLSLAYPCHLSSSSLSRTFVFLLLSPRPSNSFLTSFPHFVARWSLSIRSHSFLYIWNISTSPRQTRRDPAM